MVRKPLPVARRESVCFIEEDGRSYCIDPLDTVLSTLAKRWSLLVIGVLGNGESERFNALKRGVPGIAARALSERLEEFQQLGLVERRVLAEESPPGVRYRLTPRGRAMRRALVPLLEWADTTPT